MAISLLLFPSQPAVVGGFDKTSFSMTPTEITEANALDFFRSDHTPILFENGISKSKNFKYATCVVFDIDNGHSDAPEEWVRPSDTARRLKELGINYWLVASRNHKIPKLVNASSKDEEGNMVESQEEKSARPKFHGFLPLATPIDDPDKFVRLCEWCIKTFKADPKVKSKAQKIFGYGDNPNATVKSWNEGCCIDEVLTDEDLAAVTPILAEQKEMKQTTPSHRPHAEGRIDFNWQSHLADLEALGWYFYPEKDGVTYFQTPDGDHSAGKHDGNIKEGIGVYFFSKAPAPFENEKCYSIPQLFAGALFGDIGKEGQAIFSEQYLPLDFIVLNPKAPLASAYIFLKMVYSADGIPTLIFYAGDYWHWVGNSYRTIEPGEVGHKLLLFLEKAKIEIRSDNDGATPVYEPFPTKPATLNPIENMLKIRFFQSTNDVIPCWIGEKLSGMPSPANDPSQLIFGKHTILNLENMETLSPSPYWFNIAELDYDYDPNAKCPQWKAFLDSLFEDDVESKRALMEWMGLCLTPVTKFQKAMFLVGPKRSGKGTIARILQKIVGGHNTVSPATSDFGQSFGLQSFIGKTLAIISDARFGKGNMSQVIERVLNITGEDTLTINRKYRDAFTLRLQTKLMFISNEIPSVPDQSGAFASRFIFLKLSKTFFGREDLELENKLSNELPGIFRLAVRHLKKLLERGRFVQPETGKALANRMKALSSPVGEFMRQLLPYMSQDEIWSAWKSFAESEGLPLGTKSDLWNNLDTAGYNRDFDTLVILAAIQEMDQKVKLRNLQQHISKYRQPDGADKLGRKLREMVKDGLLVVQKVKAENGRIVEWFCIPDVE